MTNTSREPILLLSYAIFLHQSDAKKLHTYIPDTTVLFLIGKKVHKPNETGN